ncbi:MAG: chorismate synthase [Candidatus Zixiibacteriota bacterium]|nr:MAG: chorismate synthase [candidate division Zixibacteria bacterium]
MLRYLTSGESHGPQLTAIVDGLPAGLTVDKAGIDYQLARRQKGSGRGGRMKIERDKVQIVSGIRGGVTLGSPITVVISNRDWENWIEIMEPFKASADRPGPADDPWAGAVTCPRPGHADLAGGIKYHHHDLRNVLERASARETAARVAVGAISRQLLELFGVRIVSHVIRIGQAVLPRDKRTDDIDRIERLSEDSEVRCIDKQIAQAMMNEISAARDDRDSVGGTVEVIARGLPAGLGGYSQWDQRLDGRLAAAMMSIPSAKGVEIGLGFEGASRRGSQVHDSIYYRDDSASPRKGFYRKTNNAGGLEGGITNGEDIVICVAGKPLSTLQRPLDSVDVRTKEEAKATVERSDHCAIPALAVVAEAVASLVLTEAFLQKFGSDNLTETRRNYDSFLAQPY